MISSIVLKTSTYIKYNRPCVLILEIPWDKGRLFSRVKKSISWNTIEKYQGYITGGEGSLSCRSFHETRSVFSDLLRLVASFDKPGVMRTYSNPNRHGI